MSIRDERKQQSRQALLDAALRLSASGRSFSAISLREITREVGLVPAAFYRHFQNLDQLADELVDLVALHFKGLQHQFNRMYLHQTDTTVTQGLESFLLAVEQYPEAWIFMTAERWGGCSNLRLAIAREIDFLIQDLSQALQHIDQMRQYNAVEVDECKNIASLLVNLSFTWAMTWISAHQQDDGLSQQKKQQLLSEFIMQIKLIFRGRLRHDESSNEQQKDHH